MPRYKCKAIKTPQQKSRGATAASKKYVALQKKFESEFSSSKISSDIRVLLFGFYQGTLRPQFVHTVNPIFPQYRPFFPDTVKNIFFFLFLFNNDEY